MRDSASRTCSLALSLQPANTRLKKAASCFPVLGRRTAAAADAKDLYGAADAAATTFTRAAPSVLHTVNPCQLLYDVHQQS